MADTAKTMTMHPGLTVLGGPMRGPVPFQALNACVFKEGMVHYSRVRSQKAHLMWYCSCSSPAKNHGRKFNEVTPSC